jgi:hypothetical protein
LLPFCIEGPLSSLTVAPKEHRLLSGCGFSICAFDFSCRYRRLFDVTTIAGFSLSGFVTGVQLRREVSRDFADDDGMFKIHRVRVLEIIIGRDPGAAPRTLAIGQSILAARANG